MTPISHPKSRAHRVSLAAATESYYQQNYVSHWQMCQSINDQKHFPLTELQLKNMQTAGSQAHQSLNNLALQGAFGLSSYREAAQSSDLSFVREITHKLYGIISLSVASDDFETDKARVYVKYQQPHRPPQHIRILHPQKGWQSMPLAAFDEYEYGSNLFDFESDWYLALKSSDTLLLID